MDVSALQRLIAEDVSIGRTPLMVIADVGTLITGHVDNILRVQSLCKSNDVWLHLRGHGLASLALQSHQLNGHVSCEKKIFAILLPLLQVGSCGFPLLCLQF